MHEIITLQFGQQANHVGTHYWNTQESYFTYSGEESSPVNHDVSFRAGIGADGSDTYTPRTLIYDLKGAFGTLRRENALYELQHDENPGQLNSWGRDATALRLPPIQPSPYQQALDAGTQLPTLTTYNVRFWSDYNHVFYHPRSIVQLNEYELNSSLMPFERYQTGEELFANLDRDFDLLDRDLRPFLEECDQLQGIQVLTSTDDAWGGFTTRYLERVADELGKGSRWVFALEEGKSTTRERRMLQLANSSQSMYSVVPFASMYIPLTTLPARLPSYVTMDCSSRWHTSALQAAVLETTTLPARLKEEEAGHAKFAEMEATLAGDGLRPIANASLSVQSPEDLCGAAVQDGKSDNRMANGFANGTSQSHDDKERQLDMDFLPSMPHMTPQQTAGRIKTFTRVESARGAWHSTLEVQDANLNSRDRFVSGPRTTIHQSSLLYPILSSHPTIFDMRGRPEKLALDVALATSTKVSKNVRGMASFVRQSYGVEEREAVYDGLVGIAEEYEEGMDDLSSDESENDD